MTAADTLELGRESFRRREWTEAWTRLSAAQQESSLDPEDLERLAMAAYLTGRDTDSADLWGRAHAEYLARGEPERAAKSALWLAFGLFVRGELAPATGWIARAGRLLDRVDRESAEKGFLLAMTGFQTMFAGDPAAASPTFSEAAGIGDRFRDADVSTLARLGLGDCRIRLGDTAGGLKLLDEVMVAVTAGEVSPMLAGLVYCAVISACHAIFDLRRAQEWTAALTRWCESQPGLVAYRGVCLVHRAEILQLRGAWPSAVEEARQACERLSQPPHSSLGSAWYRAGELHRLRGEFAEAEEAYRQASRQGRKPDPGLALLRLAQGQVDVAAAGIRRVAEESQDRRVRSRILPAYVEIMLASGDVPSARAGADELSALAAELDVPFIRALSAQAAGAVLLAEGETRAALAELQDAGRVWHELDVPYEGAQGRVLVGLSSRRLGDEETAKMELDAARRIFLDLGALPDAARAEELSRSATVSTAGRRTAGRASVTLGPGSRLGPYEILSSIGAGGMGEVFRARDTRLGRDVAVKILPAAYSEDPESVRRFEKEARAVASLSHPNVVPLFDVGEQDGIRYAVAEFVAGETLRARMARGPLPPVEAAGIASQIAEGLAAAHQTGFVHRDIKPENVVLARPGFARILDFGLAKRNVAMVPASVSEDEATQSALLTAPGVIAGTVGYMSPEQVRGEPVDGRSDIFSLGVVLWEMLTGRRPFRGDSPVETLSAILREEPPPDPNLAGLPADFERILRRSLEKRPEDRYHSAADLAHDLRGAVAAATITATRPVEGRKPRLGKGTRIALVAAALIVAVLAAILLARRRPAPSGSGNLPRTIAVLPFRPLAASGMPPHFGLGLADSVIGSLATLHDLTVRPTSAIARYETSATDSRDVGRQLGVDAVLEGTYQKLEGVTRITVQMTDVSRGGLLWSDRIDLPEGRLFQVQDEISRQVVDKLRIELDPSLRRTSSPSERVPDQVVEQYLAARAGLSRVSILDPEERQRIAASFDPIIERAPDFARALGARAYARAWVAFVRPTSENYAAALSDADRAIEIDPGLAEPRVARASLAWSSPGGWDIVKAVRELKEATARSPGLETAHFDLARIYYHNGWQPEFERAVAAGERINPSGLEGARQRAASEAWNGDPRKALEKYDRLPEQLRRSWAVRWQITWLRAILEDPRRVEAEVTGLGEVAPELKATYSALLAILRARQGRDFADLERQILAADHHLGHFHHVYQFLADAHALRGEATRAASFLRQAAEAGMPCASCFDSDPLLASVRGSKEYAEAKREIERSNAGYRAALKDVLE